MAKTTTTHDDAPAEEGDAFMAFLAKYKTVILAAVLILSGVYLYGVVNEEKSEKGKLAAAAEFAAAGDNVMMLQEVIDEFPDQAITPIARMKLAQSYYRASNYTMASSVYDEFLAAYPGHDMASAAVLGKAHCIEGSGDLAGAIAAFDAFLNDANHQKQTWLLPQATLGKARCLASSGKLKEARDLYEEFVAGSDEGSQWSITAQQAIDDLDIKIERLEETAAISTPTPAVEAHAPEAEKPAPVVDKPEAAVEAPAVEKPVTPTVDKPAAPEKPAENKEAAPEGTATNG